MKRNLFKRLHCCNMKGSFIFRLGDTLKRVSQNVPNLPGVYVIYSYLKDGTILLVYYGKSGMDTNGVLTRIQGLYKRINNVGKNDVPRQKIFNNYILENELAYLKVHWFVTWDTTIQVNPCIIESELYVHAPVNRKVWLN